MKAKSAFLGDIEVAEEAVLTFREGLLGLPEHTSYALFQLPENDKFYCLQSLEDPALAFFAVRPWDFFPDYEADIPDGELADIGITRPEEAALYCILTISGDIRDMTANLLAPLVVGMKKEGKQVVLAETEYETKHRLFPAEGV